MYNQPLAIIDGYIVIHSVSIKNRTQSLSGEKKWTDRSIAWEGLNILNLCLYFDLNSYS